MVFYDALPTELWFRIYKIEHSTFLDGVNKQIKTLLREIEILNQTEHAKSARRELHYAFDHFSDFPRCWANYCPRVTHWTIKEWISFNYVHPTIFIRNNGSLDISSPKGTYGYGYSTDERRDIVVMYLEDWWFG